MAKVIWKGNGIGILISSKGIKIIPPCDPELLAAFEAISGIQNAQRSLPADVQREATAFSAKLGSVAFNAAQRAAGEQLDAEGGVVFYDADDGFTCGSTGRPPIPLPRPNLRVPVGKVAVPT